MEPITLQSGRARARLLRFGAILQDLRVEGIDRPLVLGHPDPAAYKDSFAHVGAVVGRFANRIAGARFDLDGTSYQLDANDRGNCLHGGSAAASLQDWTLTRTTEDSAMMTLTLPDGAAGFPGRLQAWLRITLNDDGRRTSLDFDLQATCDSPSPCSLTHHGYFALGGDAGDQLLTVHADRYLPVDGTGIPLPDAPAPVFGTRFDYRQPRPLGRDGIDHCFCLSDGDLPMREVATLQSQDLRLRVMTTAAGLQIYDGGHFPAHGIPAHKGQLARPRAAVAFEAQAWPDAPNRPDFPNAILRPGDIWQQRTRYEIEPA
ncbi:aldose epimerase family protein [Paracoccus sp. 1_MG-2023]|uniref:aldose epimerase family protein n=1 Tax=unclassified Paracoccus (in: a-proteobacteria) TaxID=2688777 RepID=UPI001C083999|nr:MULTISPECIES: aldose epimerase family protein [unclassified Paracoccus (in: a-proteobacteria)]MBU2957798.1 galactose mutarotase [Paracoccus sp. C2R09]MDO6667353.1 aldose epimerase family protein [Paracoccus sp. 1_MG-2023]